MLLDSHTLFIHLPAPNSGPCILKDDRRCIYVDKRKVLPVLNKAPHNENVLGSGGIAPRIR
jgi:hypothetical protein